VKKAQFLSLKKNLRKSSEKLATQPEVNGSGVDLSNVSDKNDVMQSRFDHKYGKKHKSHLLDNISKKQGMMQY
jgi:hypothetical protein